MEYGFYPISVNIYQKGITDSILKQKVQEEIKYEI